MLLRCLQAPCPRGWQRHDSPVLSAGDAFLLPVRINAPGLTQCMLECICTYTLKGCLGHQRGPGKRAQPQAGLQVELWRSSLQRRQGCHSSEERQLERGTGREILLFRGAANCQPSPILPLAWPLNSCERFHATHPHF